MTTHLGFEKHDQAGKDTMNRKNGTMKKILRSDQGPLEIEVPHDREGEFEPEIVPKHQREFKGFNDWRSIWRAEKSFWGYGSTGRKARSFGSGY